MDGIHGKAKRMDRIYKIFRIKPKNVG